MTAWAVMAALCACSASNMDGISVGVALEAPSSPPLAGASRVITTDLGYRVAITRGYVSIGTVEVFACGPRSSWRELFLREAHAHTPGSSTRLGVPAVESLLAPAGTRLVVGDIHPPAGTYCRVRQTIRPADGDAVGLPAAPAMAGKSLLVEGTYRLGDEEPVAFTVSSAFAVEVETAVAPASLSIEGTRVAQLILSKTGEHWFDAIAFASEPDIAPRVLQNIRGSIGARFQ